MLATLVSKLEHIIELELISNKWQETEDNKRGVATSTAYQEAFENVEDRSRQREYIIKDY